MAISTDILCFAMLKMGSEVLSLCLIGYYIYGTLKAQKNIRDFKGIIEERKFTRSFWCPKCGSKIDIHKRKPCPNCKCELYRNMKSLLFFLSCWYDIYEHSICCCFQR